MEIDVGKAIPFSTFFPLKIFAILLQRTEDHDAQKCVRVHLYSSTKVFPSLIRSVTFTPASMRATTVATASVQEEEQNTVQSPSSTPVNTLPKTYCCKSRQPPCVLSPRRTTDTSQMVHISMRCCVLHWKDRRSLPPRNFPHSMTLFKLSATKCDCLWMFKMCLDGFISAER